MQESDYLRGAYRQVEASLEYNMSGLTFLCLDAFWGDPMIE